MGIHTKIRRITTVWGQTGDCHVQDQIQKGCCLTADQLRHTLGDLRAHLQPLCDQASSGPDLRAVLDVAAALDNHDARPQVCSPARLAGCSQL